jgi:hypothetical protein
MTACRSQFYIFRDDLCVNNETQSGAGTAKPAFRPEARPAIFKVLDRQQKHAFGRIVKLIDGRHRRTYDRARVVKFQAASAR